MNQVLLSGEFDHTLDPKGRITLPARYRNYFSQGAVVVRFPDGEPCLCVFHPDSWDEFDAKYIEPLDVFANPEHKRVTRQIYRNREQVDLDPQGRVLISAQQIKELGLSGKVKILGNRTHLEIWNPATLAEWESEERGHDV